MRITGRSSIRSSRRSDSRPRSAGPTLDDAADQTRIVGRSLIASAHVGAVSGQFRVVNC
jgi:hypothetical protein